MTPANPSVAKGLTEQFTATGTYTDGSTQNLTSSVDLGFVGHHGRHDLQHRPGHGADHGHVDHHGHRSAA